MLVIFTYIKNINNTQKFQMNDDTRERDYMYMHENSWILGAERTYMYHQIYEKI